MFRIIDQRNGSSKPLNPTVNVNGDWHFNKSSNSLFYMGKTPHHLIHNVWLRGKMLRGQISNQFQDSVWFKCLHNELFIQCLLITAVPYKLNVWYILTTVSGKDRAANRRRRNSVDRSLRDRPVYFNVYQCYYPKCITPTRPPPPPPGSLSSVSKYVTNTLAMWHDSK